RTSSEPSSMLVASQYAKCVAAAHLTSTWKVPFESARSTVIDAGVRLPVDSSKPPTVPVHPFQFAMRLSSAVSGSAANPRAAVAASAKTFTESYAYGVHPLGEPRYRDAKVSRRDAEPGKS